MAHVPGAGKIVLESSGTDAVFAQLAYSYPLKILSPRCAHDHVGVAYLLNYGGGLVGGDEIDIHVDVRRDARLVLLTQGSTKIFKKRTAGARSATAGGTVITTQRMNVSVDRDCALFLLPDPATCFKDATYEQRQTFHLAPGASALILDSLTAGRISRGEEWDLSRYLSINEVWLDGTRLCRDALLLEQPGLRQRLAPYDCYSTLLLVGPLLQTVIDDLTREYSEISQMRVAKPPDFLWSLAVIDAKCGAVLVRIASMETEAVRTWLRQKLGRIREHLGEDAFQMAFPS